jgi:hypothetical protein
LKGHDNKQTGNLEIFINGICIQRANRKNKKHEKCKNSVITGGPKFESFQMFGEIRQVSASFPVLFCVVMDLIIRRVTEGQESGTQKLCCMDDIVMWGLNESTLRRN